MSELRSPTAGCSESNGSGTRFRERLHPEIYGIAAYRFVLSVALGRHSSPTRTPLEWDRLGRGRTEAIALAIVIVNLVHLIRVRATMGGKRVLSEGMTPSQCSPRFA